MRATRTNLQISSLMANNGAMDKMTMRRVFADNLDRAMKAKPGMNQTALAKAAGVSQPYVSALLHCHSAPTIDMLTAIAAALDCEPWELLANDQATREAALRKILGGDFGGEKDRGEPLAPLETGPADQEDHRLRHLKAACQVAITA
jgi:transcriptional regulator with XRE-family HTH domain